ncbi:MAG: hypothetical protein KDA49_12390, partial [Rhodospirillaceae bacterium]|nr:hypothetical protein [Rhodospirillaceae bacterium]
ILSGPAAPPPSPLPPPPDETAIRRALHGAWSRQTAAQWLPQNPARGQCNVTAAVIFDLLGGQILRTRLGDAWHYYNRFGDLRIDFTDSQFAAPGALFAPPIAYDDEVTTRGAAMAGVAEREHATLRHALISALGGPLDDPLDDPTA